MNLRKEILKPYTRNQCNAIVHWIGNNQLKFDELFGLFIGQDIKLAQSASWPLSYCIEAYPLLIDKHLNQLIIQLQKTNVHDAVKRNTMRLLQQITIPQQHKGIIMNCAFDYIQNHNEKAAVKAFSLNVLANLAIEFPDIIPEVKTIIEERMQYETPAFKSSANRFLKITKKIKHTF